MIRVRRFTDGVAYARLVTPFLLRNEAVNNLAFRILGRFADGTCPVPPDVYLAAAFASDAPDAAIVGAAMRTPPFNLCLAYPGAEAVDALVDDACAFGPVPGVIGETAEARAFAARWSAVQSGRHRRIIALRVHALTRVNITPGPGTLRAVSAAEAALVSSWVGGFHAEATPGDPPPPGLLTDLNGFYLWVVDGAPVTLVRGLPSTPHAAVINTVYTPPEHRRRGHATSAVAAISAELLAAGRAACVLFTDAANPTSNAIYQRIGYRPVADFENIAFELRP
jgi:ribosomal protein S18 acetylase RimI-like enzyme